MIEIKVKLRSETGRETVLSERKGMAAKDLIFRSLAIERFELPVAKELFYFGRPLFQLLEPLGVRTHETKGGLELEYCDE